MATGKGRKPKIVPMFCFQCNKRLTLHRDKDHGGYSHAGYGDGDNTFCTLRCGYEYGHKAAVNANYDNAPEIMYDEEIDDD